MYKKILLIFLSFSFVLNAQDTIRGKMNPVKNYNYIILNQLNNVNKKYITNADIKDGAFTLVMPKDSKSGMYRLEYDINNNLFIDILYNNEEIQFEFHPEYPNNLIKFSKSDENKLFQEFIDGVSVIQNKLDSVQVQFFQTKEVKKEKELEKIYNVALAKLKKTEKTFAKKSLGTLASHFIKANKRFYDDKLIKDTNEYLENLKSHYYDNIDFNSKTLIKSSLLIDRVMDYVLYLTNSNDPEKLTKLRTEAITFSLSKIEPADIKKDIIQSLMYLFAQEENKEVTDYIIKNHFNKLPVALQDFDFKNMINDLFKTSIGQQAPNIEWDVYGKQYSLANLDKSEYYVVVFWSSSCPHCLKELPELNKFLIERPNIKTLAIGLESEDSKANWKEETFYYENLTHILGIGKWKSKYSQDYGVTSTPSYFVLDSDKKIIAKPYDFKKLEEFFKK
jgi:thiol-disulfide isomerase/thioredoxin